MHVFFFRLQRARRTVPSKRIGTTRTKYRRFATAAEAIRHAVELLANPQSLRRAP
jgi:hypothetical protein